jgi:hypothetical protein
MLKIKLPKGVGVYTQTEKTKALLSFQPSVSIN